MKTPGKIPEPPLSSRHYTQQVTYVYPNKVTNQHNQDKLILVACCLIQGPNQASP